jgi:hypothetical protein
MRIINLLRLHSTRYSFGHLASVVSCSVFSAVGLAGTPGFATVDHCQDLPRRSTLSIDLQPIRACGPLESGALESSNLPIAEIQEAAFMEKLRRKIVESVESSRAHALHVQACYSSDSKNLPSSISSFKSLDPDACRAIKSQIDQEVEDLPRLRQLLALSSPRLRSDVQDFSLSQSEKINISIKARHSNLQLKSLSKEEALSAIGVYDSWIRDTVSETPKLDELTGRPNIELIRMNPLQSRIKSRVERGRQEAARDAALILRDKPFLNHFDSDDSSDAAIVRAAQRLHQKTSEFASELQKIKQDPMRNDALKLLTFDKAVKDVVRENPELCAAANRRQAALDAQSARDATWLLVGAPLVGTACTLAIRMPVMCFGTAGTGAAAYHWKETRAEYQMQISAFDTAISDDQSLVNAIETLNASERDVFIAGVLVFLPYEAVLGKAWLRMERIPAFRQAVEKVSSRIGMNPSDLIESLSKRLRQRPSDPAN